MSMISNVDDFTNDPLAAMSDCYNRPGRDTVGAGYDRPEVAHVYTRATRAFLIDTLTAMDEQPHEQPLEQGDVCMLEVEEYVAPFESDVPFFNEWQQRDAETQERSDAQDRYACTDELERQQFFFWHQTLFVNEPPVPFLGEVPPVNAAAARRQKQQELDAKLAEYQSQHRVLRSNGAAAEGAAAEGEATHSVEHAPFPDVPMEAPRDPCESLMDLFEMSFYKQHKDFDDHV